MKSFDKVLRGSFLNVVDLLLKVAAATVITPLMIHGLQLSGYGLWLLVVSVVGYCGLLDLGITFSASRFVAMEVGAGRVQREALVLEVAARHFRRMAWIILALCPLVVWLTGHWVADSDSWHVKMALAIVLGAMVLRFMCRKSLVVLRGVLRHDLIAMASIIRGIVQFSLMCWVLRSSSSIIWVAVVQAGGEALEQAWLHYFASGFLKKAGQAATSADEMRQTSRKMHIFAAHISLIMIGEAMRFQTGPLIVHFHSGLEAVPLFSVGLRLLTMLQDIVGAVFGGTVLSVFSQLHGAGDEKQLRTSFFRYSELAAGFSSCAVLGSVWLAPAFFERWVGHELAAASDLMLIAALPYALHFAQFPAHNLMYSLNRSMPLAKLSLYGGAASAILGFILGAWWGVHGVVAGLAIEMLVSRMIVVPVLVSRVMGVSVGVYLLRYLGWPALKVLLPPACCALVLRPWLAADYGRLALLGSAFLAVSALSFFFHFLKKEERLMIYKKCGWGKGG